MTVSNRALTVAAALVTVLVFRPGGVTLSAEGSALALRAVATGATPVPFTVELTRWSTDAERAPLLAALAPPPAAPAAAASAEGAGRGGRAGRAGRGGARGGGAAAAPASPFARLATAIKAAPTVGFVWSDGVTGYSVKYAWRSASAGAADRIVLITDRQLGAHAGWPRPSGPNPDAEFTLIEMRIDAKGMGEGKTSLTSNIVVDATAQTLALDGYEAAPLLLKVTR